MRVYKFYSAKWGLDALYRERLKLSTDRDINDPFEFLAAGKNKASRVEAREIRSALFKEHGIISFCETWSEPLLWSHYADNHRGLALGFDLNDRVGYSVNYTDKRVQLPQSVRNVYRFGEHLNFHDSITVTKHDAWSYEQEVRVFPDLNSSIYENGFYFRTFNDIGKLRQVIIGADYSSLQNSKLADELRRKGMEILTARSAFENFSVVPQNAKRMQKEL